MRNTSVSLNLQKVIKKHKIFWKPEDFVLLMAPAGGFEPLAYRLGGGRSIQLSYGNIFKIYSIIGTNLLNVNRLCPKGGRYNIFLGGERSIQLSYWHIT